MATPVINTVSPSTGPPGTKVTLTGSGFSTVTGARVGGAPASFTVVSDTELTLAVPQSLGNGVDDIDLDYPGVVVDPSAFNVTGGSHSSTFNVLNYGADPSGTKLSTAAFTAALAAAQKYGKGATLYAPKGTYLIDDGAATPSCIHLTAAGIGFMGDGDVEGAGTKLLLAKVGIGPNGNRPGIIGGNADGLAIEGLFLDSRTNNNTYPHIIGNPDPEILNITSSHNRVSNIAGRSGTGFCVRFYGSNPCESAPVGDNIVSNLNLDTLSYGGGFIALDCDCQGLGGATTSFTNIVLVGSMAIFYASHVLVDQFTFTPSKYQAPCANCIEISTTAKGPSHDITITNNIKSNGGKISILYKDGAGPIANLSLPTITYWNPAC